MRNGEEGQMQAWIWSDKDGIKFIGKPDWLQAGVDLGFSTRGGGVSPSIYDSLNLGLHVGDREELVRENRRRLLAVFDAKLEDAVCCQQVHGSRVSRVDKSDRGRGAYTLDTAITGCDALLTNQPGTYLLSLYADCVPVYFYDPLNRAIAIAHCGWKGTMAGIVCETLEAMHQEYQTVAEQTEIFIGPGIGACCFHIQNDLAQQVRAELGHLKDVLAGDAEGLVTWDLQETNRQLLVAGGVCNDNIKVCKICTSCHPEWFYSHRREQGDTGRMGAVLGLKY
jgi:YfiH family protein